jgi:hypothetical protein
MLIKQPNNVCIEAVEASDFIDGFLVVLHISIIFKLLDKVK